MVTWENKDRDTQMSLYHEYCHGNSKAKVHRPQPMVWYRLGPAAALSKFPDGHRSVIDCTHHSAFQPVSTKSVASDWTRPHPLVWRYNPEAENTQVTWCCSAGTNYRCATTVTGVDTFWDLHLRDGGRTYLGKVSRGTEQDHRRGGREHEDEGGVHVGDYETDFSSHDTNSPKCDSRSDESSTCMSPVHESVRRMSPDCRSTVISSSSIKNTCGSKMDFPTTAESVAEDTNSFVRNSKQIHARPSYISELPRSQQHPSIQLHHPKTEYNRPASYSEGESILVNKSIPLLVSFKDDDRKRWLRSPSPPHIEEHFSGEHVTCPRFTEDDIIANKGNVVTTGVCFITEQGPRTSPLPPTTANEENARNSPVEASSEEQKQNTLYCTPKEHKRRPTVFSAVDDVRDSLQDHATLNTTDDNSSSSNGIDYPHEKAYDMKPAVIVRDVSTAVAFSETESSVLQERTRSKGTRGRQDDEDTFILKYPEIGEQSTSSVLRSAVRNHTRISSTQNFEETISSKQKCDPDEYNIHIDEEQPIEDRGESPHESSHLEYHTKNDEKQLLLDRRVLPHASSPIKNNPIGNENILEYRRSDYAGKCSPTVNPIHIGDQQSLEDTADFLQNTSPMGNYIQNEDKKSSEDCSRCLRRNIPSEIREIVDREFIENEVVQTEQSTALRNRTQTADQQFTQSRAASPRSSCPLDEPRQTDAQQHLEDQNIPFQRSTVLVQSRDWRPSGEETVVQQMGAASDTKLGTEASGPGLFSAEDTALRSRVLILLWVLLGERRLREVGYPVEPVHRILWRAVDVCCSVAGVKSAAAVPLNADHDCGLDMLCFRDHTHRFLEVCAPTRELWKQFGWASLTVDAVVRKIYDEELVPLLRLQVLPPGIQQAVVHLAKLDRTPLHRHSSSLRTLDGDSAVGRLQTAVVVPAKKKRGRPAKISHKVDEGGRIERVMLWRFLLNLLEDPRNAPCIHWVQREEGIFRILNTDWLARLWGRRHGNPRMTYEKMARAMRTYYRSKVLQPVPRLRNLPRKLVYKFNPAVIHKVAAMKLSCSTFSGRGLNYNTNNTK